MLSYCKSENICEIMTLNTKSDYIFLLMVLLALDICMVMVIRKQSLLVTDKD